MIDRHYREIFRLRSGEEVLIRPLEPRDGPRLQRGLREISVESNLQRFFGLRLNFTEKELAYLTHFDPKNRFAIGAIELRDANTPIGPVEGERGLAIGRWMRVGESDEAECALVVADDHQKNGLGVHLFELLMKGAREQNVRTFIGSIRVDNVKAQKMLRKAGKPHFVHSGNGELSFRLSL